jgi:K+-transporting ATPase ATPase B chain
MSSLRSEKLSLLDKKLLLTSALSAVKKINPRDLYVNPIMFTTAAVAFVSTMILGHTLIIGDNKDISVIIQIVIWLWFTVIFANFAEAIAEGRGKAQAESLRKTKVDMQAKKIDHLESQEWHLTSATSLRAGDLVIVEVNDTIPGDGDVVWGIATVDESAITGESAPVIRENGGDRSAVTGGTRVVSDKIIVRISVNPGESFLDRMIALVEGAKRQKTPNEIALTILLVGLTLIFLMVCVSLPAFAHFMNADIPVIFLIALFVTLIPTTIGGLLSAIGIAGMDRLIKFNVIAKSGRAVEAAGDVDTLLIDKTGTITLGNRQASEFIPLADVHERELAEVAFYSSLIDETPEGKSIIALAMNRFGFKLENVQQESMTFIPFTAQTRMSGVDMKGDSIRKGSSDKMIAWSLALTRESVVSKDLTLAVEKVAKAGGTPLVVGKNGRLLGVIYLKDIIKPGIQERFRILRSMGIRTVMVTGDNPLTAAAIAAEAGVDDFLAEATPEQKLALIREEQAKGRLVAMCGDGSNDAPALAQADVGVAMNTGTQAAREAGNMVDLDSDPTKLIEIVMIGKQLLMSRGSLTTFSIANDVAKYFAIIPALFLAHLPLLSVLNIMHLASAQSAILSAIIFNALIIIALVPLALKGVRYNPGSAETLLRRNLLLYGLGGLIAPFIGIKIIDLIITALGLA